MFRFDSSVGLVADEGLVWSRVADVKKMPEYWPSLKSVQLENSGEKPYRARVTFADGAAGSATIVVDNERRVLVIYYESGPWAGTQRMEVDRGQLRIFWDLKLGGFLGNLREGGKLKTETLEALEKLAGLHAAFA